MSYSKVKPTGNTPKELFESIVSQCSNNNQICFHIKRYPQILSFLSESTGINDKPAVLLYHYFENIKEIPKCICGKNRNYHCYGYRPTCGDKNCIYLVKEESKKRYCLENYGVEYVFQDKSFREKSKQTLIKKYGVDNITKLPEVIKKRKESNLKKWGVEDPISLGIVRGNDAERGLEKIQNGLPDGYIVLDSDKNYTYKIKCPKGHVALHSKGHMREKVRNNIEICNLCNEYQGGSRVEQELFDFISSIYEGPITRNDRRLISPYEIDIILEGIKLCIEFNGDYWHSQKVNDDQYYHQNKLNMCLSKGYDLIQIRENDWYSKKEIIKERILKILNNEDTSEYYEKDDSNRIIFDMSRYISPVLEKFKVTETTLPQLIRVGQYYQWDSGYKICGIKVV
jgi:very-short-patch-repair endonuclease